MHSYKTLQDRTGLLTSPPPRKLRPFKGTTWCSIPYVSCPDRSMMFAVAPISTPTGRVACFLASCAGEYSVKFSAPEHPGLPVVGMTIHVAKCGLGDVTVSTGDACQTCGRGFYSFNPLNSTCDICVPDAECGNSTVVPVAGFWSSSPQSTQMHRCVDRHFYGVGTVVSR